MEVVIGNGVVGNGQLAEGGQLADILQCLAGDFVAPDVQALQFFQLGQVDGALVRYLVVVDEELSQFAETAADGVQSKIRYIVFPHNQRLYRVKLFDRLEVFIV